MQTREQWLLAAIEVFRSDLFKQHGYTVPVVKVSVGFPKGRKKAIGQIYFGHNATDGISQIFVHPSIDDAKEVLAIVVHELVHSIVPLAGHGKEFRAIAIKVGLEGKMRSTTASDALKVYFDDLIRISGNYPHSALNAVDSVKKQTTRMIKCECLECGCVVRIASKWLQEREAPLCSCNSTPFTISE